ncbi:hypothetical protein HJFPF1_12973 [Paramyrothecium foliicola]|nr:hypothetical protein HJFPF1_12973 [Paramyrothecium foliicola]
MLEVHDMRYDVSSYGNFMRQLPPRANSNEALVAAMDALTSVFSRPSSQVNSVDQRRKYGHALRELRICLGTPKKAITVETLCAVYLLMLVQVIGMLDTGAMGHEEGLVTLLNVMAQRGFKEGFETEATAVIAVSLLYSSMINDKIQLGPILQKFETNGEALKRNFASSTQSKESQMIRRGFGSLSVSNITLMPELLKQPEIYYDTIRSLHKLAMEDREILCETLCQLRGTDDAPESSRGRLRRDYQASYGMASAVAVTLNQILQSFDPRDETLVQQAAFIVESVLVVAEEASEFRPFGSSCMAGPLAMCWGATNDMNDRIAIAITFETTIKPTN